MQVRERCRAKLNLFLDVRGKRPDGYHELLTVFHEIDLADTLTVADAAAPGEITLTIDDTTGGEPLPTGPDNLVVRAARALLDAAGSTAGVALHLEKRIPAGGGLGGGSADAAGALRAIDELLALRTPDDELDRLALSIGSDVPFLLRGGTAVGWGRGEMLVQVTDVAPLDFLLLVPTFGLSTAAVYGACAAGAARDAGTKPVVHEPSATLAALRAGDADALIAAFHNALEAPAERVDPRLARLRAAASDALGRRVCLTGSGSTLFVPLRPGEEPTVPALADLRTTLRTRSAAGRGEAE